MTFIYINWFWQYQMRACMLIFPVQSICIYYNVIMSIKKERKETNENAWKFIITRGIVCQKNRLSLTMSQGSWLIWTRNFRKKFIAKEGHPLTPQAQSKFDIKINFRQSLLKYKLFVKIALSSWYVFQIVKKKCGVFCLFYTDYFEYFHINIWIPDDNNHHFSPVCFAICT